MVGRPSLSVPRGRVGDEGLPERVEISTPPALRSHSSGDSEVRGEARVKEVFDAHLQEMFERGEASGPIVNTLVAFADQIRLLNGQVNSMHREWCDENQQMRGRISCLSTEVATQADADRMRLIVQRFAAEVMPDSRAIVRYAIDEQSVIMDERINSLSTEVQSSVRDIEGGLNQLHQVVEEKHTAMFGSNAVFEDQANVEIGKIEKRAVRSLPSVGTPAALGPDRATSSGADEPVRNLTERVDRRRRE